MPSAFDPALLAQLPRELRAAVEAQFEKALTDEAELRQHLEAENADLRTHNDRLEHLVRELQRARFGPGSEKLHPDRTELAFEERAIAAPSVRGRWRVRWQSPPPRRSMMPPSRRGRASGRRARHEGRAT